MKFGDRLAHVKCVTFAINECHGEGDLSLHNCVRKGRHSQNINVIVGTAIANEGNFPFVVTLVPYDSIVATTFALRDAINIANQNNLPIAFYGADSLSSNPHEQEIFNTTHVYRLPSWHHDASMAVCCIARNEAFNVLGVHIIPNVLRDQSYQLLNVNSVGGILVRKLFAELTMVPAERSKKECIG